MNYMVAWGNSASQVRIGTGDKRSAALEAYGTYDPRRMTIMAVSMAVLRSGVKRTKFIAQILLPEHERRMLEIGEEEAANFTRMEIQAIDKLWRREWERYDKRYGGKHVDH